MVRKWAVRPDPATGVANRDEIVQALMDGEALLHRAGGVLEVVVVRAPTEIDGEMWTTGAIFSWKDRTDARPQPEAAAAVVERAPVTEPDPEPEELEAALTAEEDFLRKAEALEDESSMAPSAR